MGRYGEIWGDCTASGEGATVESVTWRPYLPTSPYISLHLPISHRLGRGRDCGERHVARRQTEGALVRDRIEGALHLVRVRVRVRDRVRVRARARARVRVRGLERSTASRLPLPLPLTLCCTASRLSRGSPMPMKTRLRTGGRPRARASRTPSHSCAPIGGV